MTDGGHTPYGPGAELPQPTAHAPGMFPPPGGPSGPWPVQPVGAPARRGGLAAAGIAASLAAAVAALVVGGIALTRHPAPSTVGAASTSATDTSAADKELCTAVAPVLADSDRITNEWERSGPEGSAARTATLPAFVASTKEWTTRAQAALDMHPDAQQFLRRTLQRYIDDRRLLAYDLRGGGPLQPYDEAGYADSMIAYAGPLGVCADLGVKW